MSASIQIREPAWLREFKAFLMRGSVVELAVGLVVGAAFTTIVTSLVEDLINPLIGLVPLHSDYDTLAVFGYARAIFSRARCVVNIQLIRAPEPLRWRSPASTSETSRSRFPIRPPRHCPRSTPISIATMLSQLACLGV